MTCGPYRGISLITYTARIESANTRATVSAAPALSPALKVDLSVSGEVSAVKGVKIVLKTLDEAVLHDEQVAIGEARALLKDAITWDLKGKVQPWWPVGYGDQNLYNIEVSLLGDVSHCLASSRLGADLCLERRCSGQPHKEDWFPERRADSGASRGA